MKTKLVIGFSSFSLISSSLSAQTITECELGIQLVGGQRLTSNAGGNEIMRRDTFLANILVAALLVGTFFIPGFYAIVQGTRERLRAGMGMSGSGEVK